jgi:hypothetical protein
VTPFDIDWPNRVLDDLADLWLQSTHRQEMTAAEAEINRLLQTDPVGNGVHVSEGLYRLSSWPLVVLYEINVPRRRVRISSVRELQ